MRSEQAPAASAITSRQVVVVRSLPVARVRIAGAEP
jgi:hypothetical protein